ncbi:MAG: dihydrolipoamide acetyltransferase family protein [Mycobacteriales bacterium]
MHKFLLPDLGEGLTEARIIRWLVGIGDLVSVDQPVVEVETEKAAVELPCPYAGSVGAIYAAEGDLVDVGRPLLSIGSSDELAASLDESTSKSGNVLIGYGTTGEPRRGRRRGAREPVGLNETASSLSSPARLASPAVRKLAREHGIDLQSLIGSGPDGVVLRVDLEHAISERFSAPDGATRVPLSGSLGAAAANFVRSRREIPDATCWVDADATRLMEVKEVLAANCPEDLPRIGVLTLLARICVAGLGRYPALNATVDTERNEIVRLPEIRLGFAVQSARGLVVAVARPDQVGQTWLLAAELHRLTSLAGTSTLGPTDMFGSTFTVNNYGTLGVDGSTPIINYPEGAMLGIGRITPKPWEFEGTIALRQVVQLSLTFDHRICDGSVAGGFLRFVADHVEQPLLLLREM